MVAWKMYSYIFSLWFMACFFKFGLSFSAIVKGRFFTLLKFVKYKDCDCNKKNTIEGATKSLLVFHFSDLDKSRANGGERG